MNIAECKNSKKYCHKHIDIGIDNTFIGNTFCQSIVIGIANTFHKYC